jgi:hypothetical protein
MRKVVVNQKVFCYSAVRGGFARPKNLKGSLRRAFLLFRRFAMRPFKLRDERKLMPKLQEKRERKTPGHRDPAWMHDFWANLNRRGMLT